MARRTTGSAVVFLLLAGLVGCASSVEPAAPPDDESRIVAEIVFRGRYSLEKHCREIGNGHACGEFPEITVEKVFNGELAIKGLANPTVPKSLAIDQAYLFRWRLTARMLARIRSAEAGGYRGMWIDGESIELVEDIER